MVVVYIIKIFFVKATKEEIIKHFEEEEHNRILSMLSRLVTIYNPFEGYRRVNYSLPTKNTTLEEMYCDWDILVPHEIKSNSFLQDRLNNNNNMTTEKLKSGMIVEDVKGRKGICIDTPVGLVIQWHNPKEIKYSVLEDYKEDLEHKYNYNCSIIRIFKINKAIQVCPEFFKGAKLIWEREEETIEFAGEKYNKEEFEQAIKNLRPIE